MPVTLHDVAWSHHDVSGHSLEEVARHIEAMAEAGRTQWHPTYHATRWDGNTIAQAQVDVHVSVTMPHWAGAASAPHAEQAEWDRFLAALRAHEEGHVQLATQYLQHADTLLEGWDEHTAHQQWVDNLANLQAASDQYDAGNAHGQSGGTVITLP